MGILIYYYSNLTASASIKATPFPRLPMNASLEENECTVTECWDMAGTWCVNNNTLLCKPESDGWLVWLRRVDGSVRFARPWIDYVTGFGDPDGNYWLGLEKLHLLTGTGAHFKLRVDLGSWYNESEWAEYLYFDVGDENTAYKLRVGVFTGNTNISGMGHSNGKMFSTFDRDNDVFAGNCASQYGDSGGWWYGQCSYTKPTARYGKKGDTHVPYMWWLKAFGENHQALKSLVMKVRPVTPYDI